MGLRLLSGHNVKTSTNFHNSNVAQNICYNNLLFEICENLDKESFK